MWMRSEIARASPNDEWLNVFILDDRWGLGQESLCIWMSMWRMKMESVERLPGLDRRGLRKRASARRKKRHRHLLLTQHLPNFGTESEIGVETMSGERSLRGKGPARPNFSWEEFELAQRPTKSLLTPGTHHYNNLRWWSSFSHSAICLPRQQYHNK